MKLGHRVEIKQTQDLVITTELRQAIEILQFNSMELNEFLQKEMEENPLLEIKKDEVKKEEIDWDKFIESNYGSRNYSSRVSGDFNDMPSYDNFVSSEINLEEYILSQLGCMTSDIDEYLVGKYIIQNLDSDGYLRMSVEEISKNLEYSVGYIEKVLEEIQKLEPAGIGARDLKESLLIQARFHRIDDPLLIRIISNNLEDIGFNRIRKISKELGISLEEVQILCDNLKKLDPSPGRKYSSLNDEVRYIEADASIRKINGEFIVLINDVSGPRLHINSYYKKLMEKENDDSTKEFLSDRFDSAMWIIKSIEQRRQTMLKVINSILKYQKDFFEKQGDFLVPLTLKEVAEDIGMHESTISRVTNGKYIDTPKGLYELKYFFNGSVSGDDELSNRCVKNRIVEIIEVEDKIKPYSDQKIAEMLKLENIEISRRTVAK